MKVTIDIPENVLEELAARLAPPLPSLEGSPWHDVQRAAEYCVMKEQAIRDAARAGHLRSHKTSNGRLRFHLDDLEAFLRGGTS